MGVGETSLPEFSAIILHPAFKNMAHHCLPGAKAFVCTDWRAAPHLVDAAQGVFHELKNLIVWAKTNAGSRVTLHLTASTAEQIFEGGASGVCRLA